MGEMISETLSFSEKETEAAGYKLGLSLSEGETVGFLGDLGAGKTVFVRGICRAAGFDGRVSSPTYTILHIYQGQRFKVFHYDMWRVSGGDDLETTGFFDGGDCVRCVEWSENIMDFMPEDALFVRIDKLPDGGRKIVVEKGR